MEGNGSILTTVDYQTAGRVATGVLLVVCAALFFVVLNASAVAIFLPEKGDDLSIGPGRLSWLMTGFLLIYGIAIPIYGRLADVYGARPLFLREKNEAPARVRGSLEINAILQKYS